MGRPRKSTELPKYIHREFKGGREYLTFQKHRGTPHTGPRIPIQHAPGTPEFWALYAKLIAEKPSTIEEKSVAALVREYLASEKFKALSAATRKGYGWYLGVFERRLGEFRADEVTPRVLIEMRDSFADRPVSANHLIAVVRTLYKYGVPREYAKVNPAREIEPITIKSDGAEPWPEWAIELAAGARWEVATFVAIGLYTGQRTADILAMRLQDIEGGHIKVVQSKTGKKLAIPIHAKLKPYIDAARRRASMQIIFGPRGDALDTNRWRALFRREIAKPELKRIEEAALTPHGLRKSAVVTLREMRVPIEEIQAITGQSRAMVEHYAKGVDQKMMAARAIATWERGKI